MSERLVDENFVRVDDVGGGVRALHYADGMIRIEHTCRAVVFDDGSEPVVLVTAPALAIGAGHIITSADPLAVSPSIACGDCGLHGYIRDGRWAAA